MPGRKTYPPTWLGRLRRLIAHRWAGPRAVRKVLPPDALARLGERVAASERRHTGQISICVEAGLPWSYIRRDASARERAVAEFGKLRVWDTEHNNGVLIYLLLADHAIEIVADRTLARRAADGQWEGLAGRMGLAFAEQRFEDGLTLALEEASALLVAHFPAEAPGDEARANELPDGPVVL